ncbi:MAG: inositol monophosphatase [Nocardioidaceae bacterium]|nr:inositol monophosphatase [Nocardioidaceae bacterium]
MSAAAPRIDGPLTDPELAVALVTAAGRLAARMRADGVESDRKTGFSDIVTSADLAAEALVTEALDRLRPDDGLLGEEGAARESRSGRSWVVDPVDGTWNFATGLLSWCSAIALADGHGPLLGAVHHPVADETWLGGRDLPTTCNAIAVDRLVDRALDEVTLATYIHPTTVSDPDVLEPFLAIVRSPATPRILGSASCDLAAVAGGRLGAWAQHSVAPWDWLPGKALVDAAGGSTYVEEHRGHVWCLAGNPRSAAELRTVLLDS